MKQRYYTIPLLGVLGVLILSQQVYATQLLSINQYEDTLQFYRSLFIVAEAVFALLLASIYLICREMKQHRTMH